MQNISSKKGRVSAIILTSLLLSALYGMGIPLSYFEISIAGESISFALNIVLITLIVIFFIKSFERDWDLGFKVTGIWKGLFIDKGLWIVLCTASFTHSYIAFSPMDKTPSLWSLLVRCIIQFIGVSFAEEIIFRGIILKALILYSKREKKGYFLSVIGSSVIFSLVHIVGMASQPLYIMCAKLFWTFGLGLFFSTIYLKSKSLWTVIIIHTFINISSYLPVLFSNKEFTYSTWPTLLAIGVITGIAGCILMIKETNGRLPSSQCSISDF